MFEMAESVEYAPPILEDGAYELHGFEPWSSLTNDKNIYTSGYLAWLLALIG